MSTLDSFDICDLPSNVRVALSEGAKLGLAVSGGVDSMAMLDIFSRLLPRQIVVINVQHGIRGEASIADSEFVERQCALRGVPCLRFDVDCRAFAETERVSLEVAARTLRYGVFENCCKEGKCAYVLLAHHRDDQLETLAMRLLRGTGVVGLCSMRQQRDCYLRPLLSFSREDILCYAREHNIPYVCDETNSDSAYTRNFLRNEVLPLLSSRYPSFSESLLRLSRNACEVTELLQKLAPSPTITSQNGCVIAVLKDEDLTERALAKIAISRAFKAIGVEADVEERHFDLVLELLDAEVGRRLDMPHGSRVYRESGALSFVRTAALPVGFEDLPFAAVLGGESKAVDVDVISGKDAVKAACKKAFGAKTEKGASDKTRRTLVFDLDALGDGAVLRCRRSGDRFRSFGGAEKSLGDFLTDRKIALKERDSLPLIAVDNNVLVIVGVEIGDKVKVTDKTERACVIQPKLS